MMGEGTEKCLWCRGESSREQSMDRRGFPLVSKGKEEEEFEEKYSWLQCLCLRERMSTNEQRRVRDSRERKVIRVGRRGEGGGISKTRRVHRRVRGLERWSDLSWILL